MSLVFITFVVVFAPLNVNAIKPSLRNVLPNMIANTSDDGVESSCSPAVASDWKIRDCFLVCNDLNLCTSDCYTKCQHCKCNAPSACNKPPCKDNPGNCRDHAKCTDCSWDTSSQTCVVDNCLDEEVYLVSGKPKEYLLIQRSHHNNNGPPVMLKSSEKTNSTWKIRTPNSGISFLFESHLGEHLHDNAGAVDINSNSDALTESDRWTIHDASAATGGEQNEVFIRSSQGLYLSHRKKASIELTKFSHERGHKWTIEKATGGLCNSNSFKAPRCVWKESHTCARRNNENVNQTARFKEEHTPTECARLCRLERKKQGLVDGALIEGCCQWNNYVAGDELGVCKFWGEDPMYALAHVEGASNKLKRAMVMDASCS